MYLDRDKIESHMHKVGITEFTELAATVGVAPQTIWAILRQQYDPAFKTLERLCRTLQCTPDQILVIRHRVTPLPDPALAATNEPDGG